ncbi:MAG TPA: hypothetical protein DDW31_09100 [candidate division Zixibacteria bacterium]|nr:hypothetical protein [candidate division Zixibacteria bacterium]
MRTKLRLAAMLLISAGLAFLATGCQDPYLTGANITLSKPPDELSQDDYRAVIRTLQSAIEQGFPQNYGKYYAMLAYCHYNTSQFKLTRSMMDSSIKYWPDKADSLGEVLKGYWGLQFNLSLEQLRKATGMPKDSSGPFVARAQTHLNNAMEIIPDRVEDYILQAQIHRFSGRNDEAKVLFEKAIKADPNNPDVHYQLGRIAYDAKNWDEAAMHLEKASGLKQDNHLWLFLLGEAYLMKGDYPRAQKAFQKSASLNPEDKYAWFNLGQSFFYEDKDLRSAIQAFEKALAVDDSYMEALDLLGLSYLHKAVLDFDNGIRVYKSAVEMRPDKIEYWTNLLYCYKQKKMKAEAAAVEKRIKQLQK